VSPGRGLTKLFRFYDQTLTPHRRRTRFAQQQQQQQQQQVSWTDKTKKKKNKEQLWSRRSTRCFHFRAHYNNINILYALL